jgi:hypothetical protein
MHRQNEVDRHRLPWRQELELRIAHFTVSLVVGNAPRREIARVSFGVRVDSLDRVTCDTPAATPAQRELPFDR